MLERSTAESLKSREFEIIKLEMPLQEQRIAKLEDLQYKLRQFSVTVWALLLGIGLGATESLVPRGAVLGIALLVPGIFLFLDAIYASIAQNHRTRRDRLIEHLNSQLNESDHANHFPLLDLTGKLTTPDDPQALYRKSMLVKLTRTTRLYFYGVQLVAANVALSYALAKGGGRLYYLSVPAMFVLLCSLVAARRIKKYKVQRSVPAGYTREIDDKADGIGIEEWRRRTSLRS